MDDKISAVPTRHIVTAYDEQLNKLHGFIREMGQLAGAQIVDAVAALTDRDGALATRVMERDRRLDELEREAEAQTIRLLALRQPVANDLRVVVAALRISSNLERIGDFASNVAKRSLALDALPEISLTHSMIPIGRAVSEMLANVMQAYETDDLQTALAVRQRDEEVDRAYTALFRELLTYMMESPQRITACTHLLFAAKNLERIGDHTTNIAETICFRIQGEALAVERAKGDDTSTVTVMPG
ncbi:phosphate signaling complex protein PhoU [Niveispirillum sp. BGYR6]|uniref:phosphate signaling complex protein PhoU n=1 Tax=Niveispirillum sp. BGYR6 TaxID=2971249 RepID=UPI0022B9948A|nr:phosphate signaling complex protein PhoU [Niveispirillum sp. BGYR6]